MRRDHPLYGCSGVNCANQLAYKVGVFSPPGGILLKFIGCIRSAGIIVIAGIHLPYFLTHCALSVKISLTLVNGPVAQLGARFNRTEEAGGSNPPRSTRLTGSIKKAIPGPIAQLGARLNGIEKAGGSNPPGSTEAKAGVVGHPSASRESEVKARQVLRNTETELA